jgi:hypothetical protein
MKYKGVTLTAEEVEMVAPLVLAARKLLVGCGRSEALDRLTALSLKIAGFDTLASDRVDSEPSEPDTFNVNAAAHLLIARVDRLERVLRNVAGAMPIVSGVEPFRESMAGPSDHQRLQAIGAALQELSGPSVTSEGER